MTKVNIEQAVKGYLVFSVEASTGKLFREGRSYFVGKSYHNRYVGIFEDLSKAAVNASQYPSSKKLVIYEASGWGEVTDFGDSKVTEWLKLDQIVPKSKWAEAISAKANSNCASLRALVAKVSQDVAVLRELAKDKNQAVRKNLAENLATPADVLADLAKDQFSLVKQAVAANENTPAVVLARLGAVEESVKMAI